MRSVFCWGNLKRRSGFLMDFKTSIFLFAFSWVRFAEFSTEERENCWIIRFFTLYGKTKRRENKTCFYFKKAKKKNPLCFVCELKYFFVPFLFVKYKICALFFWVVFQIVGEDGEVREILLARWSAIFSCCSIFDTLIFCRAFKHCGKSD